MGERIALRRCQRVLVAGMRQSFRKSAVCGQAGFGGGEGGAGIIGKERRRGLRFLQMVIEGENVLARFYHAFFKQIAIIGAQIIAVSSPIKGNCIKKIAAIYAIFFPVIMKYFLIKRFTIFITFRYARNGMKRKPFIALSDTTNGKTALVNWFQNIARHNGLPAGIDSAITV
jgi:hypothetical protein